MSEDTCPKCGCKNCDLITNDVDIGVGMQSVVIGADCFKCGPMSRCLECGTWDFEPHHKWCELLREQLHD